jgi:molybdate transport system ATP-binding protein
MAAPDRIDCHRFRYGFVRPNYFHAQAPAMNLRLHQVRLPLIGFTLEIDATLDRPITGVFGPSGSGKTSLLDLIAGLRRPTAGTVQMDENVLFDADVPLHLPPRFRRIGYVPQDLALFPHLSVRANLLYGYRPQSAENEGFALLHVAEVMEISALLERNVTNLSGGEQQRVGFARAILSAPRLLLLDEPMSSLDSRLKTRLMPFLHRIRDEFRIPLIYVTHDASELLALCDEVIVLERGRLIERGSPDNVLHAGK